MCKYLASRVRGFVMIIMLNRYIEGYMPDLGSRETSSARGTILSLDNEHTISKLMHEVEPMSTGSSSNMGKPKQKVVINYADTVKE